MRAWLWGELRTLEIGPTASAATAVPRPRGEPLAPASSSTPDVEYTRGVGIYPGDPSEDFRPVLVPDDSTYRNLALHRPAYHSSSYDYNLTAQLVTDGIKDSHLPDWVATSVSYRGLLPKVEREFFLDHNPDTSVDLRGPHPWVQVQLGGGASVPEIDRVEVLFVATQQPKAGGPECYRLRLPGWAGVEGSREGDQPIAGTCPRQPG